MCKRFFLIVLLVTIAFLQATIEVDDDYTPAAQGWGVTKFDNIQDAVDAYPNGAEILIHAGTYQDDDETSGVVILTNPNENIVHYELIGDSSENTIIDGENERRCVNIYSQGEMPIMYVGLTNLKLINGDAQDGAGILAALNTRLTVNNCVIKDNEASVKGGGICSINSGTCAMNLLSIYNSDVSDNQAQHGGGIYYRDSQNYHNPVTIEGSIIKNNTAVLGKGGGLNLQYCVLDFNNLIIIDNEVTGTGDMGTGGGIFCQDMETDPDANVINACLITGNLASTSGGALYSSYEDEGSEFELTMLTIYDNSSTNGVGGIHLESFEAHMDILNCIVYANDGQDQINNTGNGEVDISYSCIENGTTTNSNITSIPRVDTNNNCSLYYYSPCIDAGNPSTTYDDPDGSRADMGWKYHEQDIYTWQYGIFERAYLWKSFPKLPFAPPEDENTGQAIDVDEAWESWNPIPDGLYAWYGREDELHEYGEYVAGYWDWDNEIDVYSTNGYKMEKDNGGGCLMFSRGLKCLDNTVMTLAEGGIGWLGYFLEDSQLVLDAFPSEVIDDAIVIKTMDWSISRPNTDSRWSGTPASCYINYADCVLITTVDDEHEFRWETPARSSEPELRPVAEHFTFNDDIDYIPVYVEFDENDIPNEVAVYVNDVCCGAQVVEDTISQICAYILEEEQGEEIEFAFWYEGRNSVERRKSYLVYNLETDLYESGSLITGMPGIHYEVSFKDHYENVAPIEYDLNCYPNPFNPEITISFSTTEGTKYTEITIFNVKGQKVKTLVSELFRPDDYNIVWKGDDNVGNKVSSGVYYIRLQVGEDIVNRKVILMK